MKRKLCIQIIFLLLFNYSLCLFLLNFPYENCIFSKVVQWANNTWNSNKNLPSTLTYKSKHNKQKKVETKKNCLIKKRKKSIVQHKLLGLRFFCRFRCFIFRLIGVEFSVALKLWIKQFQAGILMKLGFIIHIHFADCFWWKQLYGRLNLEYRWEIYDAQRFGGISTKLHKS